MSTKSSLDILETKDREHEEDGKFLKLMIVLWRKYLFLFTF